MTDLGAENVEPLSAYAQRVIVVPPFSPNQEGEKEFIVRAIASLEAENAALRASLERMREALGELVRLKDGPRGAEYRAGKEPAWIAARTALAETETEQSK